ncbi:hypothetical protein Fmac_020684 [Flemingia macrophylla]|uniref:Uncharacterized protein n=1 Tax=Flemingia macrophylla TaxID=520843 RepID=A0ABD1LUT9_9FABA
MREGDGHKAGFTALMSVLRYCYELGVNSVLITLRGSLKRVVVEKTMRVTAHNNERVLLICVAYTSRHEIVNAVRRNGMKLKHQKKQNFPMDHLQELIRA